MRGAAAAWCGLLLAAAAAPSVWAEETGVIGCDDLVSLRRLSVEAAGEAALHAALPGFPACRTVARGRLGAVQRRSVIGGLPFECLAVEGASSCLWILP